MISLFHQYLLFFKPANSTYTYDTRGALRAVVLPDGRTVEYTIDPLGRRIAKSVNGVVREKYLWQGMTRLLAVYDGSDLFKYRFQYAGGRMPVSVAADGTTLLRSGKSERPAPAAYAACPAARGFPYNSLHENEFSALSKLPAL